MPAFLLLMLLTFAATLFTSATLLFLVQPMVGKMITPLLGGSPAVWNTCMVFFQALLLFGYGYAHLTTAWLGARKQAFLHILVLLVPFVFFPLAVNRGLVVGGDQNPIIAVLIVLTLSVGLPFFVVSTSAPLLQKWFASTDHPAARDPYFLYGASNLGSMIALLGYPVLVEPALTLATQRWAWCGGYGALVALIAGCAVCLWCSAAPATQPLEQPEPKPTPPPLAVTGRLKQPRSLTRVKVPVTTTAPIAEQRTGFERQVTLGRRLHWIALAAVPSSLMLGVTTYMTTDIAAIPLLWVLPLAVYLLSFILVFAKMPTWVHKAFVLFMPLAVLLLLFLSLSPAVKLENINHNILMQIGVLFAVAMVCHGELALDRPQPRYLTEFFLLMSLGGVLGGMFNGLLGPLLFNANVEYQLALVLACLLTPPLGKPGEESAWGVGADVVLSVLFVAIGAALLIMRAVDKDLDFTPLANSMGEWFGVGLLVTMVVGLGQVLYAKRRSTNIWLDAALPLALGLLVVGLYWGLVANSVYGRLVSFANRINIRPAALRHALTFGVPAVLAYTFIERPLRFGLGVGMLLLAFGFSGYVEERPELQIRSFFGVLKVEKNSVALTDDTKLTSYSLEHGTTLHGKQYRYFAEDPASDPELSPTQQSQAREFIAALDQEWRETPLTYYHRSGPVGDVFRHYNNDPSRPYGVIGLGTGTMSAYALPGQHVTFYDIDAVVKQISYDTDAYFTYKTDAVKRGARVDIVMGDARLTMERQQLDDKEKYGLLIVDAFSSDAIPVHLITWEALQLYFDRMRPDGIVLFHISNRHLDLEPVLGNFADRGGYTCYVFGDEDESWPGKARSTWVALARQPEYMDKLLYAPTWNPAAKAMRAAMLPVGHLDAPWRAVESRASVGIWTDDYSNLWSVFNKRPMDQIWEWLYPNKH